MRTLERCTLGLSVASSAPFCARDAQNYLMPLYIGAFRIIFLRNERLLIAFLVRLICHGAASLLCSMFKIN